MWQSMIFIDFWLARQFDNFSFLFFSLAALSVSLRSFHDSTHSLVKDVSTHFPPSSISSSRRIEQRATRLSDFRLYNVTKNVAEDFIVKMSDERLSVAMNRNERNQWRGARENPKKLRQSLGSIIIYIFIMFIHSNWIIVDVAFVLHHRVSLCVCERESLAEPKTRQLRWRYKVDRMKNWFQPLSASHTTQKETTTNKSKRRKQELLMNQSIIEVEENRHEMETF